MNYFKVGLVAASVLFVVAYSATVYKMGSDLSEYKAKAASKQEALDRLGAVVKQTQEALAKSESDRIYLAELDYEHTSRMEKANEKINALQSAVDAGRVQLYLSAGVRKESGAIAANDTGVGNGASCGLGPDSRSAYFILKRETARQREQLMYLQGVATRMDPSLFRKN